MNPIWLMIIAVLSMILIMSALWFVQARTGNSGIVDVAWTYGVGGLAILFASLSDGDPIRRWVVAALAGLWSLRLGTYILRRVMSEAEDGRYTRLKRDWGDAAQAKMFWFYQFQALGCVLFAVPMLIAAQVSQPPDFWVYVGIAIWVLAIGGETLADGQLARFKQDPANRGNVCQVGLWKYSRHPNYFFEWLHWWSYVALAITAPWGWLSLFAPLVMLYLITRVTGIPPTEQRAIESRGDAYRIYQRTTSPFIPWPPKTERAADA